MSEARNPPTRALALLIGSIDPYTQTYRDIDDGGFVEVCTFSRPTSKIAAARY